MHVLNGRLIFSATDLSHFLACPHLTLLSRRAAWGGPKAPRFEEDPGLEVLRQRGLEHEQKFLARLAQGGGRKVTDLTFCSRLPVGEDRYLRHAAATAEAMHSGAEIIYQGMLFDGRWMGYPDFLTRVELPSALGGWSYEVVDTKLAKEAKAGALLQVLLYADLLTAVQGRAPDRVHLALGGVDAPTETFRVKDFAAYYRTIRDRFHHWVDEAPSDLPTAVDPVPHCDVCDWGFPCTQERRAVDHLAFVAGISRHQRRALAENDVNTLAALGRLDLDVVPRLDGVSPASLGRIHHQARIQLEAREQGRPLYELLQPVVPEKGLAALPPPSPADLFFDFEGDPFAFDTGIEYLFGLADVAGSYTGTWALDRASERQAFEDFIDLATSRLDQHPDFHIYHYAPYEPTALKKLAGRYVTRIDELDRLLRGEVFVDLYRVVRQGVRASVESYSIKKIEPLYGYQRNVELRNARAALANFEAWLALGGSGEALSLFREIEGYNRDDCLSTLRLRDWLESLRDQLSGESGAPVPRPVVSSPEPDEALSEKLGEVRQLMDQLLAGIPRERDDRSGEQAARWLLAQLLEYHRRENKSTWWRYFDLRKMSEEELVEDRSALSGLEYLGVVDEVKRSQVHRYRFPPQEHELKPGGKSRDPVTGKPAGTIVALDEVAGTIDLSRVSTSKVPHPRSLIPFDLVPDDVMRSRLASIARAVLTEGLERNGSVPAALDLLLRAPPRVGGSPGDPLVLPGESPADAAVRLVSRLDRSILPIQGPPGSGKTHTGARMILELLHQGRKVGITATSHKVISNLLREVCRAASAAGQRISGIQKADDDDWCEAEEITATGDNGEVAAALASGAVRLAAGTAWLWCREEMAGSVDVLFIDEAGQFSLANALAVTSAARSMVLLGDPRQLQQPQKGLHPEGSEVSALEHLLDGQATMPGDRGIFLDRTWRLHPDICAFTSEIYYDDRLRSQPGLERQRLHGFEESGLRWLPAEHVGNRSESPEEVAAISRLVADLVGAGLSWTNGKGENLPLTLDEILIVAPYNAQVNALREGLPAGARVGTVDKFQGQEAPVVVYSMASSSAEDAPRGMEFLYSPNRLNVATSRARCLVIVVANGRLLFPECRSPEQMRLANGLCRYRELATDLP